MLGSKIKTIFHSHAAFVIEFFGISRVIFNEERETKKFLEEPTSDAFAKIVRPFKTFKDLCF